MYLKFLFHEKKNEKSFALGLLPPTLDAKAMEKVHKFVVVAHGVFFCHWLVIHNVWLGRMEIASNLWLLWLQYASLSISFLMQRATVSPSSMVNLLTRRLSIVKYISKLMTILGEQLFISSTKNTFSFIATPNTYLNQHWALSPTFTDSN